MLDRAARIAKTQVERKVLAAIRERIEALERTLRLLMSDGGKIRTRPVWQLVLEFDKGAWPCAVTCLLLLYTILRFSLTYSLSPYREVYEGSGGTPPWGAYRMLWVGHCVASPLLILSGILGVSRLWSVLTQQVVVWG